MNHSATLLTCGAAADPALTRHFPDGQRWPPTVVFDCPADCLRTDAASAASCARDVAPHHPKILSDTTSTWHRWCDLTDLRCMRHKLAVSWRASRDGQRRLDRQGAEGAVYVCRLSLRRFRGYTEAEFFPRRHTVVVGEPRAGRSDLIAALRRVLDPRFGGAPNLDDVQRPLPELTENEEMPPTEVEVTLLGLGLDQRERGRLPPTRRPNREITRRSQNTHSRRGSMKPPWAGPAGASSVIPSSRCRPA